MNTNNPYTYAGVQQVLYNKIGPIAMAEDIAVSVTKSGMTKSYTALSSKLEEIYSSISTLQ